MPCPNPLQTDPVDCPQHHCEVEGEISQMIRIAPRLRIPDSRSRRGQIRATVTIRFRPTPPAIHRHSHQAPSDSVCLVSSATAVPCFPCRQKYNLAIAPSTMRPNSQPAELQDQTRPTIKTGFRLCRLLLDLLWGWPLRVVRHCFVTIPRILLALSDPIPLTRAGEGRLQWARWPRTKATRLRFHIWHRRRGRLLQQAAERASGIFSTFRSD